MRDDRPRWWLGLIALPALVGLLVSGVWAATGDAPDYYVIGDLEWLPAVMGAVVTGVVLVWVLAGGVARRDVRRHGEVALRSERDRQRRLLTRLDHELKNPIQGIRAALADEPSGRQRRSIELQSRRLTSLMGDLRKIGELEHTQLELRPVDLTELVEEAVAATRELAGAAQRRISVALPRAPRPLPHINGDDDLLFLALSNVLANAVKYSAPGDAIEVRGRESEGWVVLEVADTGRGIRPEELDLVWEELGRSREVREVAGSGLGLPMVRAIVGRHGGTASLESWHGEGSTVTIRLPAGRAHRA